MSPRVTPSGPPIIGGGGGLSGSFSLRGASGAWPRGALALAPRRMGKDGAHFRMDVRLPGLAAPLKAISFGSGDLADKLQSGDEVDIAYTPKINEWNGRVSVELLLHDLRVAAG